MTTLSINAADMAYSADFHALVIRPAGKASFKPFSIGVPTIYFAPYPVSPAWASDWITKLILEAIRARAIAARNAAANVFSIPDRLPELVEEELSKVTGRLLKADLEKWAASATSAFSTFLHTVRGHALDAAMPGKVAILVALVEGAAAPSPSWKEKDQMILAQLFSYMLELDTYAEDQTLPRLLAKLEAMSQAKAAIADAL